MARNVAHTSASQNVDGSGTSGGNNRMERGGSVVANPVWEPGGAQDFAQRFDDPKYANMTGGYGENSVRETPFNQHGDTGKVEPASPQPRLKGWNAEGFGPRP
tara:strand:- start:1420 stop:1728 length:309 start_codon:yes stop_codon:yes gene_type:complete